MKSRFLFLAAALTGVLLTAGGCASASLELATESDPNRVINGTVNFRTEHPLPPESEVVVRVLDMAGTDQSRLAASRDLPVAARAEVAPTPTVLAEQKMLLGNATTAVPFRLEFQAPDDLLRHGLNLEARIAIGGSVRFRTVDSYLLTLSNAARTHEVWVRATGR